MCVDARQDPFKNLSELLDTRKIVVIETDCIVFAADVSG